MNYPALGTPPEGFRLEKALLTTYDLDLPLLSALIGDEDLSKFTIVRGNGDFSDLPEDDPTRSLLNERILLAAFPRENDRPTAFIHGKIWLFIYAPLSSGVRRYHLVIHSANLSPYDNLETGVWFWEKRQRLCSIKPRPFAPTSALSFDLQILTERILRHSRTLYSPSVLPPAVPVQAGGVRKAPCLTGGKATQPRLTGRSVPSDAEEMAVFFWNLMMNSSLSRPFQSVKH